MIACGGADGGGSGGAGGGGGATGSGGAPAAGSGGAPAAGTGGSGNPGFQAVNPCNAEASYVAGTAVDFSRTDVAAYAPGCLKVALGTLVTFTGNFLTHPLEPSSRRGTLQGNPITATSSGSSASFTFRAPGFHAYYCSIHGPSDSGAGMAGVVWVE